jgi:hypothetical protein
VGAGPAACIEKKKKYSTPDGIANISQIATCRLEHVYILTGGKKRISI